MTGEQSKAVGSVLAPGCDALCAAQIDSDGGDIWGLGPVEHVMPRAQERDRMRAALVPGASVATRRAAQDCAERAHGTALGGFEDLRLLGLSEPDPGLSHPQVLAEALGCTVLSGIGAGLAAEHQPQAGIWPVFLAALVRHLGLGPVAVVHGAQRARITLIDPAEAPDAPKAVIDFDAGPGLALRGGLAHGPGRARRLSDDQEHDLPEGLSQTQDQAEGRGRPEDQAHVPVAGDGGAASEEASAALTGAVDGAAVARFLGQGYFLKMPPKRVPHAEQLLASVVSSVPAPDRPALITACCAAAVVRALDHASAPPEQILLIGPDRQDAAYLQMLGASSGLPVRPIEELGVAAEALPAQAAAYAALRLRRGLPLVVGGAGAAVGTAQLWRPQLA